MIASLVMDYYFSDNEAPAISDISDVNVDTDPGLSTAEASWEQPTVTDNSGEDVTVTSDYNTGDQFPVGTTTVTYTATDKYGNQATLQFDVIVTMAMGMLIHACFTRATTHKKVTLLFGVCQKSEI